MDLLMDRLDAEIRRLRWRRLLAGAGLRLWRWRARRGLTPGRRRAPGAAGALPGQPRITACGQLLLPGIAGPARRPFR